MCQTLTSSALTAGHIRRPVSSTSRRSRQCGGAAGWPPSRHRPACCLTNGPGPKALGPIAFRREEKRGFFDSVKQTQANENNPLHRAFYPEAVWPTIAPLQIFPEGHNLSILEDSPEFRIVGIRPTPKRDRRTSF